MKADRIMWGIILLFVGGVLLMQNFHVIDFYWRNVWRFWPVFLIIAGVNILFNRDKSQMGGILSIVVLVVVLGFLYYKGQQPPEGYWFGDHFKRGMDIELDGSDETNLARQFFTEPFEGDSSKKVILNILGGGASFDISGKTDRLITADVKKRRGSFILKKEMTDSAQTLTFKMQETRGKWALNNGGNDVDFKLNAIPVWDINMNMNAGDVDFDLKDYKVRTFKFDGGAAALEIKIGDLLPITDVIVKTGVSSVKIEIPTGSGCRITAKTDLSSKDFSGFNKLNNGVYETPNYKASTKKIFITLDGGLGSYEVERY